MQGFKRTTSSCVMPCHARLSRDLGLMFSALSDWRVHCLERGVLQRLIFIRRSRLCTVTEDEPMIGRIKLTSVQCIKLTSEPDEIPIRIDNV